MAAKRSKDGPQARRLLALAAIYDGASRTEAAKIGGVTLQVVRDWVVRFNAQGPDGLIERKAPGAEKTGRQVTFSSDIIYDVLRRHEPHHILLRATRADAASGLIDLKRLADMLQAAHGKIDHRRLDRVSPLAVPVMLSIGKESVGPEMINELLDDAGESLIAEAMRGAGTRMT